MKTNRNLKKELNYYTYNDPEYGEDIEHIDYDSLFRLLTEIIDRLETIENNLDELKLEIGDLK